MRSLRIMAFLVAFSLLLSGPVLAQETMVPSADTVTENVVAPANDTGASMTTGKPVKASKAHAKKHKAAKAASAKKHHAKKKAAM